MHTVCRHLLGFFKPPLSFISASLLSCVVIFEVKEFLQVSQAIFLSNFMATNPAIYIL